eukprot:TRINITY_DN5886_c1_g1_i6.p1 TRINITY_DN5886_c1_g1~~TRINITY_DN5886_c1_g1_i6.p1  ORF type:complete len:909 (+),score=393.20 TRINITY_DN5886_c1_g1_i6:61-2727(+)
MRADAELQTVDPAKLDALRSSIAAVVRHQPAAPVETHADDVADLKALHEQQQLLCGAARALVTQPLLSALHHRASLLSAHGLPHPAHPPAAVRWTQGCLALRLLALLTQARVSPQRDGADGRVTHGDLVASARGAVDALRRAGLLRPDGLTRRQDHDRGLLVAVFNAAWGLLGALAADEPHLACPHFMEALRAADFIPLVADADSFGHFFGAAASCAAGLAAAGDDDGAAALLQALFSLDALPSRGLLVLLVQARTRGGVGDRSSASGLVCYINALQDWVRCRLTVARYSALLLRPVMPAAPEQAAAGWWSAVTGLLSRRNARCAEARLRSACLTALQGVWDSGADLPAVWSGVLCAFFRCTDLTAAQRRQINRLCADYFFGDRPAAAHVFSGLPDGARAKAGALAKMLTAAAARDLQSPDAPAWLRLGSEAQQQKLGAAAAAAFMDGALADGLLFTDSSRTALSRWFPAYASNYLSVIGFYKELLAQLLVTVGHTPDGFAEELAAHSCALWQRTVEVWAAHDQQNAASLFGFGAGTLGCLATAVRVEAQRRPDAAAQLFRALAAHWPLSGVSSEPPPPPYGAAHLERQRAAAQQATFSLLLDALWAVLPLLPPAALRDAVRDAGQCAVTVSRGVDGAVASLRLRFHMLCLRVWHLAGAVPAEVTEGALKLSLHFLAAPHQRTVSSAVAGRRHTAHDLFLAAMDRPSRPALRALQEYVRLCVPADADGPVASWLPPPRLAQLFLRGVHQLSEAVEGWEPAVVADADSGLPALLQMLRRCGSSARALNAAAADPAAAKRCIQYRNYYTAALITCLVRQSARVVDAAAKELSALLPQMRRKEDQRFWIGQMSSVIRGSAGWGGKTDLGLWLINLERALLPPGRRLAAAKL